MHRLTTSLALLHPQQPLLLCVRHPTFDRWMFPGGRIEPGEAPQAAILREVREEVGLEALLVDMSQLPVWSHAGNRRLAQPMAIIEEQVPGSVLGDDMLLDFVFVGVAASDRIVLAAEVLEAEWLDRAALAKRRTSFPIDELADTVLEKLGDIRGAGPTDLVQAASCCGASRRRPGR